LGGNLKAILHRNPPVFRLPTAQTQQACGKDGGHIIETFVGSQIKVTSSDHSCSPG
jgi:hypothetical protein